MNLLHRSFAALSLSVFAMGCASLPAPPSAKGPESAARYYDAVNWDAAGAEATRVLQEYLRVDTINPPGNETRGAQFMHDILAKEGIPSEVLEYAPGRGNIIARLEGTGPEKPLCLLSHIDVVTAEDDKWPKGKGPLSGTLDENGYVWGRGALDMKGLGVMELMTMIWLKRLGVPLKRTVILMGVAAEESDGGGIDFLVNKHWDKLGCSHSINEGGVGIKDLLVKGQTVHTISVAEKGVLWVKMTAHGDAGHGSTPIPGRAPERLVNAINKLMARKPEPVVHKSLIELAARVGHDTGGATGFVLKRPALFRALAMDKLLESPPARATMFNTVNVTGFEGRKEPNVIPSEVSAILDCRLLPGTRPSQMLTELNETVGDTNVTFEALNTSEANESTWDDPFFDALARHAVGGRPHVVAGPALSPGYTDSAPLRRKGVRAYGYMPFEVTQDELRSFHGKDERLSTENIHRGLRTLFRAVLDVSAR